jgi:tetratricopeptide (TPR) repeat protein
MSKIVNIQRTIMKIIRLMTLLVAVIFISTNIARSQIEEMSKVKARIGEILKNEKVEVYDKKTKVKDFPTDILVLDDRIEFKIKNQNTILYFSDLTDSIKFTMVSLKGVYELNNFYLFKSLVGNAKYKYGIFEELRKDLMLIYKQQKSKADESQRIAFEQKASEYRKLRVKPPITEEQRKFIVQANAFNQQKNYIKAIELYKKAIEVDQTTYPAGYSNLALLSAQVNNFDGAINYMKRYLLLEPEATDSRSAQDKIYEWESQITK